MGIPSKYAKYSICCELKGFYLTYSELCEIFQSGLIWDFLDNSPYFFGGGGGGDLELPWSYHGSNYHGSTLKTIAPYLNYSSPFVYIYINPG